MTRQILLYGDVDLNVIDGSAVWLVSLAETIARTDSHVHVQLKAPVVTDRLLRRLRLLSNVTVHEARVPPGETMIPSEHAPKILGDLARRTDADIVILRGSRLNRAAADEPTLDGKVWAYITDYHVPATPRQRQLIDYVGQRARRFFAQTPEARAYLEAVVPSLAGKTLLMNPVVPDDFFVDIEQNHHTEAPELLRLVYSGKLHPDWHTDSIFELPRRLRESGVHATLDVVGDKVQARPGEPDWATKMAALLKNPPSEVNVLGGKSREDAVAVVMNADIGLSWRSPALDGSVEVSTKMLEYAAAGTPPLINRTAAHEAIFGSDYPLFVDTQDPAAVARAIADAVPLLTEARRHAQKAVSWYSGEATANRLESDFRRVEPDYIAHPQSQKSKVLVASHDLKFAGDLIEMLKSRGDIDLSIDTWETLHKHDARRSAQLLRGANAIICEWAGPNAAWYSQHKDMHQRLIVRLHGFEVRNKAPWLRDIDITNVDTIVTVSNYMKGQIEEVTGWPAEKIVVIPNTIDTEDLNRPKRGDARFRLGIVGIVPRLKRLDRAIDLVETLIESDPRYSLHVKGRMPWEYPHIWGQPQQQEYYLGLFDRIGSSRLAEHVVFEPFGADMANWLTKMGWILSPSDEESFHLAPAEGMASGALPVVWARPGAAEVFGADFLVDSTPAAAELMLSLRAEDDYADAQDRARVIVGSYDIQHTNRAWMEVLRG